MINSKDDTILNLAIKRVVVFVMAMAGIYLILRYRRKWILKKRQERFNQENRTQSVKEIAKELSVVLRLMGQSRGSGISDREYQIILQQTLPDINWQQAFTLFQKATFSQDSITDEEYQIVLLLYQEVGQRMAQKRGIRGWFVKYIFIYP